MGALKLSYYNRQRALEVNSLFLVKGLEKNALLEKNRVSSSTYGFNGYENDNEVSGNGNHLSFEDFGYDPRVVRRWNVDPKTASYPWQSPYIYAANNPIAFIDIDGEGDIYFHLAINNTTGKASIGIINNPNTSRGRVNIHYQIHFKNKDGSIDKVDVSKKIFLQYTNAYKRIKNLTYFGEKKIVDKGLFESLKGNTNYYNGPPEKTDIPATEQGETDAFDKGFSNAGTQEGTGGGGIPEGDLTENSTESKNDNTTVQTNDSIYEKRYKEIRTWEKVPHGMSGGIKFTDEIEIKKVANTDSISGDTLDLTGN